MQATQATESEHESVVMRLYRFHNVNASSLRTVMIAKCLRDQENNNSCSCGLHCCKVRCCGNRNLAIPCCDYDCGDNAPACFNGDGTRSGVLDGTSENHAGHNDSVCQKIQHLTMFENGSFKTRMIAVDSDTKTAGKLNGTFEYNSDYREAESNVLPFDDEEEEYGGILAVMAKSDDSVPGNSGVKRSLKHGNDSKKAQLNRKGSENKIQKTSSDTTDSCNMVTNHSDMLASGETASQDGCKKETKSLTHSSQDSDATMKSSNSSQCLLGQEDSSHECCDHCFQGMYLDGSITGYPLQSNFFLGSDHSHALVNWSSYSPYSNMQQDDASAKYSVPTNSKDTQASDTEVSSDCFPDKYLIFTMGEKTYTPHQIGIKRIKAVEKMTQHGVQVLPDVEENLHGMDREDFDTVDHTIDLHGHIIGMCLSPDHRYV